MDTVGSKATFYSLKSNNGNKTHMGQSLGLPSFSLQQIPTSAKDFVLGEEKSQIGSIKKGLHQQISVFCTKSLRERVILFILLV